MVEENGQHVETFPFSRPAAEYLEVKSGSARLARLKVMLASEEAEVNDQGLRTILRGSIDARMMAESYMDAIQDEKPAVLVRGGLASNEHDALGKLREFALSLSSVRVAEISGTQDLHIIQAVNSLDETEQMANALFGRLREWYGLHFPELENMVDGMGGYCRVALAGRRDNMDKATFIKAGFPDAKADILGLVAKTSRGGDISDESIAIILGMAQQVLNLYDMRQDLEAHLDTQMREAAPNLSAVLGTGVGARLLARAGSLRRLSVMAASTIQVLGAEKALFRAIKTGSRPPKHGIIFQHALVHRAPRWQRGKIARAVASKAVIAARMDAHEPTLNKMLLEKLNVRVEEIASKYPEPPPRPAATRPENNHIDRRGRSRPPAKKSQIKRHRRYDKTRPSRNSDRHTSKPRHAKKSRREKRA